MKASDEIEPIVAGDRRRRILHSIDPHRHGQRRRLVGGEADDEDLVGVTREHLSRVSHAAGAIRDARHGGVEVELPAVVGDRAVVIERDPEIAERLIRLQTRRTSHQFLFGERVGFHGHACKQQATDLRQRGERLWIVAVARRSHP